MCKVIFIIMFVLIIVNKCEPRLKLQFSDEFNESDFIDESKWEVIIRSDKCNSLDNLNCNTNSIRNLRIINGTLVLAAIRDKYFDQNYYYNKYYSSVYMKTKQSFTFGRFEMRAALPKGKMIMANISLESDNQISYPWPKFGHVTFIAHKQTNELKIEIYFKSFKHKRIHSFEIEENLNDFNDYTFEWNETQMQWIFNQKILYTFNITKELDGYYNPFDKSFKLAIDVGVGGIEFPAQKLNEMDAYNWKCSLLMIDFIRVYQISAEEQTDNIRKIESNKSKEHAHNVTSEDICGHVMPLIRGKASSWNLVFAEEFNDEIFDGKEWDVLNETKHCGYPEYLNCNTNNKTNFQIINGTLVLAAIREKYLNKYYTSVWMRTKRSFTYGRFEMRAALPKGKMLRANIGLRSVNQLKYVWPNYGYINMFTHSQTNELNIEKFYVSYSQNNIQTYSVNQNIYDFNDYTFEWNETQMQWSFNQKVLYTYNLTKELDGYYNPFDKPFKLDIFLGVGGNAFVGQTLNEMDAYNWKSSLLIIDFIRVYQNTTEEQSVNKKNIESNKTIEQAYYVRSDDISKQVMPLIRGKAPSLNLVFAQEFNDEVFDENKWEVIHDSNQCNSSDYLNCNTNNKTNLRIINGTLVLAAIRQKYLNKYYTTPYIQTKESFTYGRFEMRAALPKGKMIRACFSLFAVNITGLKYPEFGEIGVMCNQQKNELEIELKFLRNRREEYIENPFKVEENLNDFNNYSFEWNETQMQWIFNQRVLFTFNITEELKDNYNPFDKPFRLGLNLAIGSEYYFPGQILYEKDVREWNCSLFIIDYIRVYQYQFDEKISIRPGQYSKLSSSFICEATMPTISPSRETWKLVFKDEFDGNVENNWFIKEGLLCNGYNQTNCHNNGTGIIGVTDGTAFLTLNPNNNINSVLIVNKKSFNLGRFVIRAALPHGHLLRPSIFMDNPHKNRIINIISYTSSGQIYTGITLMDGLVNKNVGKYSNKSEITRNVFDFHIYVMEWTETEIRWYFDDKHIFTASLIKVFLNTKHQFIEAFNLGIKLDLERDSINMQLIESQTSFCPMILIDYVRFYQLSDNSSSYYEIPEQNQIKTASICKRIMPLIEEELENMSFSLSVISIISISGLIMLLLFSAIFVYIYIRMKSKFQLKLKKEIVRNENVYDVIKLDDISDNSPDEKYEYPHYVPNYLEIHQNNEYEIMNN